ncbi:phosphatidylglycerol lysyltransferase domain-containing protein [Microbacterium sp. CJ88]|uniref:phosphatidylglycerol lysyltransferase domain-containing protein n=1 Tax=Microbacterium sp. CJ88 TaxID=3445672 RepID=UPI003F65FE7C
MTNGEHMSGATQSAVVDGTPRPKRMPRRLAPIVGYARRHPVAVGFALLVLVTGVATGSLWGVPVPPALTWSASSWSAPLSWWSAITALTVPDSPVEAVLSVLLALTVLAAAERILGSARTVAVMLATGVVSLFVGAILQSLLALLPEVSLAADQAGVLDPPMAIAGAIVAASALTGALWRRRIRVIAFSVLGMFALYAGDVDSWFRVVAAITGFLAGAWLARRIPRGPWHRSSTRETRSLLGALVAVTGFGPLAALIAGGGRGPLAYVVGEFAQIDQRLVDRCNVRYVPSCDHEFALVVTRGLGPALLAIVPLVLLVLAAWGLRLGRRSAWLLTLGVNVALVVHAVLSLLLGDVTAADPAGGAPFAWVLWAGSAALVPLTVIALLVINRHMFRVSAPRRATRVWLITVGAAFVASVLLFVIVSAIAYQSFDVRPTIGDLFAEGLRRFVPPEFLEGIPQPPYPRRGPALLVYQWVGVAFWIIAILATLRLYHATSHPETAATTPYRALLRRGGGTLSFLGTWAGNAHWYSDDRESAVAYRVVNGIALAVGDPICTPDRVGQTLRQFADFAIAQGWTPVFYSVHDDVIPAFRAMGWDALEVGQETVMHLPGLDMVGKRWQKVRHPLNRAEREGMTAQWTTWRELPAATATQIIEISEQWVTDKSLPEMGFTLGGLDELKDPDVALLLAIDADGRLQAVTSWMPSWRDGEIHGWTLDFMRRRDDAPNGVMEFLIAKAALLMKEQGVQVLSLSGAPLATRPLAEGEAAPDPTALSSFLGWLGGALEPVYGFASLFRFKSKFLPEYRTLYMTYADSVELPAIGAAVGRAYLPDASTREYLAVARTILAPRGEHR